MRGPKPSRLLRPLQAPRDGLSADPQVPRDQQHSWAGVRPVGGSLSGGESNGTSLLLLQSRNESSPPPVVGRISMKGTPRGHRLAPRSPPPALPSLGRAAV